MSNHNPQSPSSDLDVLVKVEDVRKKFCRSLKKSMWYGLKDMAAELVGGNHAHDLLRPGEFWAVNGISFELRRGECLGLIGRNGAGKTTLLKILNGLIKPDHGRVEMRGRVGALIALGAGFNPILTGRENIYVNGSVLGLSKQEIEGKIDEIIDFAEIREFIDAPVQSYSSGMQVRLGFAVATALNPDVLILDEVLAVGDAAFRAKCYRRIMSIRKRAAVIFVSHAMEQVARICDYSLAMSKGSLLFLGPVAGGIAAYERINDEGGDQDSEFLSLNHPVTRFAMEMPVKEAPQGCPISLEFVMEMADSFPTFMFRVAFYNAAGAIVADCNFRSNERGVVIPAGESRWRLTIDSITLKAGRYRLAVNVIDKDGDVVVWSYKQHELLVEGGQFGGLSDCQLQISEWRRTYSNECVPNQETGSQAVRLP